MRSALHSAPLECAPQEGVRPRRREVIQTGGHGSQLLSVARPDRGSAVATSRLSGLNLAARESILLKKDHDLMTWSS